MISIALHLPDMPAKKQQADTEQVGLRLNRSGLAKLRAYANAHPFQPTLTKLIDVAIAEFLERHASDTHADKPPGRK